MKPESRWESDSKNKIKTLLGYQGLQRLESTSVTLGHFRYRLKIFPVGLFARLNSDKQDSNRIPCYLVCSQIHRDSFPAR